MEGRKISTLRRIKLANCFLYEIQLRLVRMTTALWNSSFVRHRAQGTISNQLVFFHFIRIFINYALGALVIQLTGTSIPKIAAESPSFVSCCDK